MFQEYFAGSEHLMWPLAGLLIFVLLFVGVLAYVFFGLRDRDRVDALAALPLAEDTYAEGILNDPIQAEGRAR